MKNENINQKKNMLWEDMKNKNTNRIVIALIAILLVILVIPKVPALGITPGRTTLNYDTAEKEIKFSILNIDYKSMEISIVAEGELKDYVTISDNYAEFSQLDYSKEFSYKLKLPKSLKDKPGLHTAEIVALEIPKEESGVEGTHIGATVAVVSQLYVYVSCPNKCIDADLNVLATEIDGTTTLIVPVINRGEQKIEKVSATIEIFSKSGEKIDEVETATNSIEPGKRTELSGKWRAAAQGEYLAKITVFYDEQEKKFEKQISIGEQILNIERVWVSDFKLGGIAKFRILVENKWNKELKNVFANLIVYDERNYAMADVKSASEDISIAAKKELITYWDTAGVKEGEYNGKLMINYEKKSTDKNLVLRVSENSLDVSGVGYAISPKGGEGVSITTILIIFGIILVIVNLAWFVFYKKIIKRKKETKVSQKAVKADKGVIKV